MEFSFDRSRNQAGAQTPPTTDSNRPQTSGVKAGPDLNSQDPSTIANERLRKAIERNRAKQAGNVQPPPAAPAQFQTPPPIPPRENTIRQMRVAPPARPVMPEVEVVPPMQAQVESEEEAQEQPEPIISRKARSTVSEEKTTTVVSRRTVAKPDNTEFVPVKRTQRKVASQVNYSTGSNTSTTRKKAKEISPVFQNWVSKACWIFCVIMVARLIFADGGVTDFYSQKNTVSAKEAELERIQKDNSILIKEIERMKSDTGYQKKLVRDHLGFIAKDEYLVLFPKEK